MAFAFLIELLLSICEVNPESSFYRAQVYNSVLTFSTVVFARESLSTTRFPAKLT
jgi:hypothetical protein